MKVRLVAGSRFRCSPGQRSLDSKLQRRKSRRLVLVSHPLGLAIKANTQPTVPQRFLSIPVYPEMTDQLLRGQASRRDDEGGHENEHEKASAEKKSSSMLK